MAFSSSAVKDSVILTEDDIPGDSLVGRNPSSLKNEELRCRYEAALSCLCRYSVLAPCHDMINGFLVLTTYPAHWICTIV